MFLNGTSCRGEMSEGSNHRFHLTLNGCDDMPHHQAFSCLDSSKHGFLSKQIIVSESLASRQLQCWLFPVAPHGTFFLVPFEECNEGARERIASGELQPQATFSYQPPTTPPPTTTSAPIVLELGNIVSMGIERRKPPAEAAEGKEGYRIQDEAPRDEEAAVAQSTDAASPAAVPCLFVVILTLCSCRLM
jgi:hypothetical protein